MNWGELTEASEDYETKRIGHKSVGKPIETQEERMGAIQIALRKLPPGVGHEILKYLPSLSDTERHMLASLTPQQRDQYLKEFGTPALKEAEKRLDGKGRRKTKKLGAKKKKTSKRK